MQNFYRISCLFALACVNHAQDFLNFPPLQYQQANGFYQSPGFPPHFRPFGYHHGYQPYKAINYQQVYQDSPFHNDVRSQLPNPYVSDYPNFYHHYPQYDEHYHQQLDDLQKVPPTFREPIQLIPSRFPQRIENVVERIQNHFSIYNPGLIVPNSHITPILIEIPNNNATDVSSTTPPTEPEKPTTVQNVISSTDVPSESSTEAPEETATENDLSEGETNQSGEEKQELTTETSTESSTEQPES